MTDHFRVRVSSALACALAFVAIGFIGHARTGPSVRANAAEPEPSVTQNGAPAATLIEGPLTPDEALQAFRLEPGLRAELAAAEPTVVSPCAMAFDEQGRMYVAENRGYPTGPKEGEPAVGRIALLEDRDGDGRFETRREFAEGLTFPNGVMPWKGGLIVTCAPDILYLKDTDGDGRADSREVWFTGFSTTGSTQLRVSHPTLAVDGWIYVTSGLTGGAVTCPKHPDRPAIKLGRTDFRFRPDLSEYEPCDGGAQFGLSFDDAGRRFICYNRVQVQHVVLSSKQLRRNPNLAFSDTVENCPADMVAASLKGHGSAARLFPISRNVTTADSHAGTFTAACAVTLWRGDSLPVAYHGGAFSCDPTGNLVHFDKLVPNGATFAAHRVRDGVEFLASPDGWFRPVFLSPGPDGALYIVDMYRKTIEHPDYLPVEIRKHTDFESGKTMGRIWRVAAAKHSAEELTARRRKSFDAQSPESLGQALESPSGWRRSTAFRLFLERRDPAAVAVLRDILKSSGSSAPRVAALRLLDAFDAVNEPEIVELLGRSGPSSLLETAIAIASSRYPQSREVGWALAKLGSHSNARVRFATALALGDVSTEHGMAALARIATVDSQDRWTRAAVLSSIAGEEPRFLETLLASDQLTDPEGGILFETARIVGASQPEAAWPFIIEMMTRYAPETPAGHDRASILLTGLADAIRARSSKKNSESALLAAVEGRKRVTADLNRRFAQSKRVVEDAGQPANRRRIAIDLLAHAGFTFAGETLMKRVDPREPAIVQAGALRALSRMKDPSIAAELLSKSRFPAYTPGLRDEVLAAIFSGPQHLPGLLSAMEAGVVPRGAVDALRRRQLLENRDPDIKARASKLFSLDVTSDRAKVYAELKSVVSLPANPTEGKAVFKKACANCHRLDQDGHPVGPDLFGIRNQPKEAILLHIIVPDQEITPGFTAYVLTTTEGRVLTGLVSSETATSVTLKQPLGKEETILRRDIEELSASKLSLMPQNIESQVTRQQFADLLAYLKGER